MREHHVDPGQEFEASDAVQALVRDTASQLGASPEQALQAARLGLWELASRSVGVAVSPDERSLVLTVPLDAAWAEGLPQRRQALQASIVLNLQAGVSFCRTLSGPALICRWPAEQAEASTLARWVRQFVLMADVVDAGVQSVSRPATTASAAMAA